MKRIVLAFALGSLVGCANAQDRDLVGTVIGGLVGYKIAESVGAGHASMAAAAVGGSLIGRNISQQRQYTTYSSPSYQYSSPSYGYSRSYRDICAMQVPPQYANNPGAANAWVGGCQNRMAQRQIEIEQEAYSAGTRSYP